MRQGITNAADHGHSMLLLGLPQKALRLFEQMSEAEPKDPYYLCMWAHCLHVLQRTDEALELNARALRLRPSYTQALVQRGLFLISIGQFEEGWRLYEYRRLKLDAAKWGWRKFPKPEWDGRPTNKRILIWNEQALGDAIFNFRYIPLVETLCPNVIVETHKELLPLCQGFSSRVVAMGNVPDYDLQCSNMSLPTILKTRLDNIPNFCPFVTVDPLLVKQWSETLPEGFRIGLRWSGNPIQERDAIRSLIPKHVDNITKNYDVISLQYDDLKCSVHDTAAIIKNLDLVITTCTMIPHLAGALNVKTWLMLPMDSDHRWLQKINYSPWYPSIRIFRQPSPGDWRSVICEVESELDRLYGDRRIAA